jgi:hypothetical protein
LDACLTQQIQLNHEIESQREAFLQEEKTFHERKMAWMEHTREQTRMIQKEKEEAIYALETIQYKPIHCPVDATLLTKKVSLLCPYQMTDAKYELYSDTIAHSLQEIERLDDCLECLHTAEGSPETPNAFESASDSL